MLGSTGSTLGWSEGKQSKQKGSQSGDTSQLHFFSWIDEHCAGCGEFDSMNVWDKTGSVHIKTINSEHLVLLDVKELTVEHDSTLVVVTV